MHRIFKSLHVVFRFVALSFVLTFLLLLAFSFQVGKPSNLVAFFYMLSIPFYYYFLVLLFLVILSPLSQIPYLKYVVIIPKVLLDIFLLADIFVFNIYRFHIDMLFVNMMIHDFSGIGLSPTLIFLSIIAFIAVILINLWVYRKTLKKNSFKAGKFTLALLVLFVFGQLVHVWANEYRQQFITKYTPYFPHYLPLTSSSTMTKLKNCCPKMIPKPIEKSGNNLEEALINIENKGSIFNYPKQPLVFNDSLQEKPNILFFLTESWRADMISDAITPNIADFAANNYQFTNHYSTGSVTVSGLFGLMYGLHPSYLKYAQSDAFKHQTVFTKSLVQLGYDISVYTPSNLDRFSLKPMFFGAIDSENYINESTLTTIENDQQMVTEFINDINNSDKPWFKFVFLDSSHHSYDYPPENEKFLPIPKNSEAFIFNKNIASEAFFNDYKNSLNYIDALFEKIHQAIEQAGIADNTIIVITSDHGEEFNDNSKGYWGHGSNFTSYQTAVPLIIKIPENQQALQIDKLSGHVDIVPTIMSQVLHCSNPISDYSSGYNLLNLPDQRGLIMASYTDKGYLIGDQVYANGLSFESYFVDDITTENEAIDYEKITKLRKEETSFLNKN